MLTYHSNLRPTDSLKRLLFGPATKILAQVPPVGETPKCGTAECSTCMPALAVPNNGQTKISPVASLDSITKKPISPVASLDSFHRAMLREGSHKDLTSMAQGIPPTRSWDMELPMLPPPG